MTEHPPSLSQRSINLAKSIKHPGPAHDMP